MKGNKLKGIIGIGVLTALLWTGCSNGLDNPAEAEQSLIRVVIDGTTARTVVPSDPGFSYTLSFTAWNKSPVVQDIEGSEETVYLESGEWTLRVTGKKGEYTAAESDDIQVSVSPGPGAITVPVTMHPVIGGADGTFHYAVNLDAVPGTSVTITLNPLNDGGSSPSPIEVSATREGNISLAPGYYLLQAEAERGELSAYQQETVHIYSHIATAKEYRFIESNFFDSAQTQWKDLVWYVSDTGSDSNNGLSSGTDLATAGNALELIRAAYSSGYWPLEADNTPKTASIVIQGTITADYGTSNGMVEISGTNTYPPVELRGPVAGTGTLDATGKNKRVLYIADGNSVTLGDNLTLTGGKAPSSSYSSYGGGVFVGNYSSFTMNGGEISRNSADVSVPGSGSSFSVSSSGGGVFVESYGRFIMSGGEISGNSVSVLGSWSGSGYGSNSMSGYGGGVYASGDFTMSGGEISGNSASVFRSGYGSYSVSSSGSGGGVYVSGDFTMSGGEISGNSASGSFTDSDSGSFTGSSSVYGYGGGVYVDSGSFTMSGGEISGNSASVSVSVSGYGYATAGGGGVYVNGGTFKKQPVSGGTSGVIYGYPADNYYNSNWVRINGAYQSYSGSAVYVSSTKRREATAGQTEQLDSEQEGNAGGWGLTVPNITISLDNPVEGIEDITLSRTGTGANTTAALAIEENYTEYGTEYTWYINGRLISGATSATLVLNAMVYPLGENNLMAVVKKTNGMYYAKEITFTVIQ